MGVVEITDDILIFGLKAFDFNWNVEEREKTFQYIWNPLQFDPQSRKFQLNGDLYDEV